jgi:hypothetical protein
MEHAFKVLDSRCSARQLWRPSVELIAPTVGSVTTSDGSTISADQKLEGGPSVLYDAVALDHDGSVDTFLQTCVAMRFWQREAAFT